MNEPKFSPQSDFQDLQEKGKISRILSGTGFGYVKSNTSQKTYIFSLDAVPNYRGQTPQEIGIKKGAKVRFRSEGDSISSMVPEE